MPDDRPESPAIVLLEKLRDDPTIVLGKYRRELLIVLAALSTPAGPEERAFRRAAVHQPDAPSPREEAWAQVDAASPPPADALGREEAVEAGAKALGHLEPLLSESLNDSLSPDAHFSCSRPVAVWRELASARAPMPDHPSWPAELVEKGR